MFTEGARTLAAGLAAAVLFAGVPSADAGAKDSRSFAGYEPGLKDTPFFGGTGSIPTSAGGKAAAKPAKKSTKKGGSAFGTIFGKKG